MYTLIIAYLDENAGTVEVQSSIVRHLAYAEFLAEQVAKLGASVTIEEEG